MNAKKLLKSWHLWVMVTLVVGAVLFFQGSLNASIMLPLAIIALCPVMMMLMMKDKNHKH